jgi:signal transduction histidine kinase
LCVIAATAAGYRFGVARIGRGLRHWGISARSAFVAATVVFVALVVAGAVLAVVLYRSMLSGIDSAAAARVADIAAALDSGGVTQLGDGLLTPDQRIVAVQIIAPNGAVVRKSPSAPDTPLIPINEIDDGLHVGIPEHPSPYGSIRFTAQTVDDGPRGRFIVLVGEGSQAIASTVWTAVVALAVASPVVIAVSAAVTYLLVRRSMRSVDEIRSRVAEISTSELAERVPVPESRDEIAALAVTMNEMLARIEAGHSAQRRFVADASHELRSPLATILSALEVVTSHPELLSNELTSSTLLPEAQRMKALVDDLLLLARVDEDNLTAAREDVDLDDIAAAEVERLRRETALDTHAAITPTRLVGDGAALTRVLRNLLDNAVRHAASRVEIEVRETDGHAIVVVSDDGPGIPVADRIRVFDRFVRLDADRSRRGGGSGLGLAIAREIVVAHRGTVAIDERLDGGTRVTVRLPLAQIPARRR